MGLLLVALCGDFSKRNELNNEEKDEHESPVLQI